MPMHEARKETQFYIQIMVLIIVYIGLTFSISCASYGLYGFFATQLTPLLVGSPLQLHGFLYLVSIMNLIAALFVFVAMPETKVREYGFGGICF